jgi:carboxypeptidase C (cathepsin A)
MPNIRLLFAAISVCLLPGPLAAQDDAKDSTKDSAAEKSPAPKAEQWVTRRSVVIGGKTLAYVATAGTLIIRDTSDAPVASIGYVAYTRPDVKDPATRPITFAYNGGPGSASLWLHMGALGPRRVVATDAGPTPPPPYAWWITRTACSIAPTWS